ncbi:MAG: radical SAM protein [Candidatus Omnitrophica bacterium]|nr:radical SAM protein [Candidatus Omnitrophota bacterium]
MRFKNILLAQAKYDSVFSNVLPAGIGYLSEFLTANGIENDVFDLNVAKNTEKGLFDKIRRFKPNLFGLSMMSLNYKYNYGMLGRVKALFPEIRIVAGGAHVSTMREEVLRDCPAIDYGIVIEGEHALVELAGDGDIAGIKGLIHRDGSRIVYNGDRPFLQDLDSLPYPKYEKFDKTDYSSLISLFSSRGCPFECTYCPVQLAIGRRFVTRSAKSVADELEYHYNLGRREFSFRDDNFTLVQERVYQVCDEIERRRLKGLYLMCDNGVRADKIDHKILKRMKEVGFRMIGLGVESGDDGILKSLKKSSTVKTMEEAIKTACDLGYIVELYFLIGAPGETWKDFEKTVSLATKYPVMIASFYHILPYPRTELFESVKKSGYLLRSPEEYLNDGSQRRNTPFLSTPEFPYELRKKAFDYAYRSTSGHIKRTRRAYSRNNAYRKFRDMGLGPRTASALARIYASGIVYEHIVNNKFISNLRKRLKNRMAAEKIRSAV